MTLNPTEIAKLWIMSDPVVRATFEAVASRNTREDTTEYIETFFRRNNPLKEEEIESNHHVFYRDIIATALNKIDYTQLTEVLYESD